MEIEKTLAALKRNHMQGIHLAQAKELPAQLAKLVLQGSSVGWGDSVTLEQLGVFTYFRNGRYTVFDKHQPGLSREQKRRIYLDCFDADTFITGVNAITMDGKLFFIDGNGSRTAPVLYGPRQVIVIAGTNKIVAGEQEAVQRARQIAAPLDARRLEKETPCAKLGRCVDCHHQQRICNSFVLLTGQFSSDRVKVVMVDGSFGY